MAEQEFKGAPVYTAEGAVGTEVVYARGVREPRGERYTSSVVTTSHGPPGAPATMITHRRRVPVVASRVVLGEEDAGDPCSALVELLMVPELRDAVLQWLPCCDLCRARRICRRFSVWVGAALAAQRAPAIIGNAKRDYSRLDFTQKLDPRKLSFQPVSSSAAPSASSGAPVADDCVQLGGRVFALRGSALYVAQLPTPDYEMLDSAPPSPAVEPVSSPERSQRETNLQTPQKARLTIELVGTPTSAAHPEPSPGLLWEELLRIPSAGDVRQSAHEQSFDRLRVGGRLCVDHDGALLLIGGGVEQTIVPPPHVARDVGAARAAAVNAAAMEGTRGTSLGVTAQVLRVDPSTGLWQRLPDLLEPRRDCVTATLPNGAVVVAGGAGIHGALASAEIFDPEVSGSRASIHTHTDQHAHTRARVHTRVHARVHGRGSQNAGRRGDYCSDANGRHCHPWRKRERLRAHWRFPMGVWP